MNDLPEFSDREARISRLRAESIRDGWHRYVVTRVTSDGCEVMPVLGRKDAPQLSGEIDFSVSRYARSR